MNTFKIFSLFLMLSTVGLVQSANLSKEDIEKLNAYKRAQIRASFYWQYTNDRDYFYNTNNEEFNLENIDSYIDIFEDHQRELEAEIKKSEVFFSRYPALTGFASSITSMMTAHLAAKGPSSTLYDEWRRTRFFTFGPGEPGPAETAIYFKSNWEKFKHLMGTTGRYHGYFRQALFIASILGIVAMGSAFIAYKALKYKRDQPRIKDKKERYDRDEKIIAELKELQIKLQQETGLLIY